ncbi:tyrosyl-DNA phosphodiesterase 1 [Xylographa bjoerkii]|nr:tyrosyl-DNA phosphodiesterase 1 [Xylographa bjoerkii]
MDEEPKAKRRRFDAANDDVNRLTIRSRSQEGGDDFSTPTLSGNISASNSLTRPISPPITTRSQKPSIDLTEEEISLTSGAVAPNSLKQLTQSGIQLIPSPIHLTKVEGLSPALNIDTISLQDLVGDPLIRECWVFNYLFDVEFLMSKLDEDVRSEVQVKIIHGSWKKEDSNRLGIEVLQPLPLHDFKRHLLTTIRLLKDAMTRHKNVQSIAAYMPEAFGTHHSKMIINIRHDYCAQINIFTANIVAGDWRMCQAVWRSPLLPLSELASKSLSASVLPHVGTGARFKADIIAYLNRYGNKLRILTGQLIKYDFGDVHAALVASTPGRQNLRGTNSEQETLWGWPGLKNVLRTVPSSSEQQSHVVMQVSSVASLGSGDSWLRETFQETLASSAISSNSTLSHAEPKFSLVFPTADSIRRSVDGYGSGGSIHMKTQTLQGVKQLKYLRPLLCHWSGDHSEMQISAGLSEPGTRPLTTSSVREAGRRRAAPHIKTYMRFTDESMTRIDWAMVTSANLSTQAWGAKENAAHEVRVCSYEIGVVVWPGLWGNDVEMVPTFGKDIADVEMAPDGGSLVEHRPKSLTGGVEGYKGGTTKISKKIGMRMPYDLPLVPYRDGEMPWCTIMPDNEPDWMGRVWPGFGAG